MTGIIKAILIADTSGEALYPLESAILEAGGGIVGDRYYLGKGAFSEKLEGSPEREVSLIEQEEIEQFNHETGLDYTAADFRRNIVTEGIRLNDLVGKEFYLGKIKLKGIRLCEPCAYLAEKLGDELMTHMLHKAGLRAQVLAGGEINVLDTVRED